MRQIDPPAMVLKRDGSKPPLDVCKIRSGINKVLSNPRALAPQSVIEPSSARINVRLADAHGQSSILTRCARVRWRRQSSADD